MFNVHDSNTLDIFTSLFAYDSLIHQHNTRQSVHFHVSLVKRDLSKTGLSYRDRLRVRIRSIEKKVKLESLPCCTKFHEPHVVLECAHF